MNEDIAEKKKFKILDLSKKFLLPNIFELDEAFEFFWKKNLFKNMDFQIFSIILNQKNQYLIGINFIY